MDQLKRVDRWIRDTILDPYTGKSNWYCSRIQGYIDGFFFSFGCSLFFGKKYSLSMICFIVLIPSWLFTIYIHKKGVPPPSPDDKLLEKRLKDFGLFGYVDNICDELRSETYEIGKGFFTNLILDGHNLLKNKSEKYIPVRRMITKRIYDRLSVFFKPVGSNYVLYFPTDRFDGLEKKIRKSINNLNEFFFEECKKEAYKGNSIAWKGLVGIPEKIIFTQCNILIISLILNDGINKFIEELKHFNPMSIWCLTLFLPVIKNFEDKSKDKGILSKKDFPEDESCNNLFKTFPGINNFIPIISYANMLTLADNLAKSQDFLVTYNR